MKLNMLSIAIMVQVVLFGLSLNAEQELLDGCYYEGGVFVSVDPHAERVAFPEGMETLPDCSNMFNLKEVLLPSTATSTGYFAGCTNLVNIIIPKGPTVVRNQSFCGCSSLEEIRFPKTITYLGVNLFTSNANNFPNSFGVKNLRRVIFDGDAPCIVMQVPNQSPFAGTRSDLEVIVGMDSKGWGTLNDPNSHPAKWPLCCDGGLRRRLVVDRHVSDMKSPVTNGFVVVRCEVKGCSAIVVPDAWTNSLPSFAAHFGSDFKSAILRPTGKRSSSGEELCVWHDYVAGTDPTDLSDVFYAWVEFDGQMPRIEFRPKLPDRKYTVYGKERLCDAQWCVVSDDADKFNFFRVTVELE